MRCPGQFFREEGNKRQQEGKNVTQKEIKALFSMRERSELLNIS